MTEKTREMKRRFVFEFSFPQMLTKNYKDTLMIGFSIEFLFFQTLQRGLECFSDQLHKTKQKLQSEMSINHKTSIRGSFSTHFIFVRSFFVPYHGRRLAFCMDFLWHYLNISFRGFIFYIAHVPSGNNFIAS